MILKFGQTGWFETRDGRRALVMNAGLGDFCIVGKTQDGHRFAWTGSGCYAMNREDGFDLVRHLPDCDSWGWVEPKVDEYRPFATAEEVFLFADRWVRAKSCGYLLRVIAIDEIHIHIGPEVKTFHAAFERYEFLDGTPFGMKVSK